MMIRLVAPTAPARRRRGALCLKQCLDVA
jgi:hypothetical protein